MSVCALATWLLPVPGLLTFKALLPCTMNIIDVHLAQQHALIRQADEYADLFTHADMAAGAALSRAMDAAQSG